MNFREISSVRQKRQDSFAERIINILPEKYSAAYEKLTDTERRELTEIRIRADRPCSFTSGNRNIPMSQWNGEYILSDIYEIESITEKICGGSVYTYADMIKQGYIPYCGTRVGVCGNGTEIDGIYAGQHRITSLSFRIPGYIPDAADSVLEYIRKNGFEKTMGILAVSPPNCGKTTFLRALAAGLSDSSDVDFAKRVCIIDERGELCNPKMLGTCLCDVISGVPKKYALEMAIRTMSPQVVVLDEIGNEEQTEMLYRAYVGGVYIAASLHAGSPVEMLRNEKLKKAFLHGVFSTVYYMDRNAAQKNGIIIPVSEMCIR